MDGQLVGCLIHYDTFALQHYLLAVYITIFGHFHGCDLDPNHRKNALPSPFFIGAINDDSRLRGANPTSADWRGEIDHGVHPTDPKQVAYLCAYKDDLIIEIIVVFHLTTE